MSKFTKCILTFCGIALLIGGVLFGVGLFFGERSQQNPWFGENVWRDMDVTVDGVKVFIGENAESIEKKEVLAAFENIYMKAECANVSIVTGTEFQITCTYPKDEMPEFKIENETLEIIQDRQEDYTNTGNVTRAIIISVPEQTVLKDITLENVVGNISIADINAYRCLTTLTTGNVTVDNSEIDCCNFTISTGNVDVTALVAEECYLSTSTGKLDMVSNDVKKYVLISGVGGISLDLGKATCDYAMEASTNVGKVYIDGEESGLKYEEENGEGNIRLSVNVGDINIKTK